MDDLDGRLARPGAELRFQDAGGDGPAVVLLHGAGMDRTAFAAQRTALADAGWRPIAVDLRGHGASVLDDDARFTIADAMGDIGALIDHLSLERPILVGHSLGGNLAQLFVRHHPERVGGLVVIGSTWNTGPLTFGERIGIRLAAPTLRMIPASRLPQMMAGASAVRPEAVAEIRTVFERMGKARFAEVWTATIGLVAPDPGYRTPVPLALIRGAEDATGNIATAMPRWAETDGAGEHVIPGAGHVVMLDAPEETSRVLLEVLSSLHGAP